MSLESMKTLLKSVAGDAMREHDNVFADQCNAMAKRCDYLSIKAWYPYILAAYDGNETLADLELASHLEVK